MRVIKSSTIRKYQKKYAAALPGLEHWLQTTRREKWASFGDVRASFPSADYVQGPARETRKGVIHEHRVVFNINGNHFRLVARLDFEHKMAFVLFFGSHADYDRVDVATLEYDDA
jgi:mRNA interferase HigB